MTISQYLSFPLFPLFLLFFLQTACPLIFPLFPSSNPYSGKGEKAKSTFFFFFPLTSLSPLHLFTCSSSTHLLPSLARNNPRVGRSKWNHYVFFLLSSPYLLIICFSSPLFSFFSREQKYLGRWSWTSISLLLTFVSPIFPHHLLLIFSLPFPHFHPGTEILT